ncbi:MAG: 2-amino-4-hydroxy-6-hydroxymethyldihydropteridine diphosphokinase [Planctomyces sp.]|nr:2-amino-4-hydroxy-6-hydroxymethyldihydropteridine diphosphokinase [Planctomyces sp.]
MNDNHCHRAWISLGGNQNSPISTMRQALRALADIEGVHLGQVSSFYQTAPVGSDAGERFTNAAAALETTLEPDDLLKHLLRIEHDLGRVRTIHWGPRILDLDLLFYDNQIIHKDDLIVPHPAAWYRRFVLVPLSEIAPDLLHPVKLVTITELLRLTEITPYTIHLIGSSADLELARAAAAPFPQITIRQITSLADVRAPHSISIYIRPTEMITFEECPLLTRISLAETEAKQLQQTIRDLFTAALGDVVCIEPAEEQSEQGF